MSCTWAVTLAGVPRVKRTVMIAPLPSGAGVATAGSAARFVSEIDGVGVGVGVGGSGLPVPSVPVAGRAPSDAIVQVKRPEPAAGERHVQSIAVPTPAPLAAVRPSWSTTVTVHGSDELSRARTGVAMTRDRSQRDDLAGTELRVAARRVDDQRQRVDVGDVEPPREQLHERVLLGLRRRRTAVVAHQRNTRRAGVEALGMS